MGSLNRKAVSDVDEDTISRIAHSMKLDKYKDVIAFVRDLKRFEHSFEAKMSYKAFVYQHYKTHKLRAKIELFFGKIVLEGEWAFSDRSKAIERKQNELSLK